MYAKHRNARNKINLSQETSILHLSRSNNQQVANGKFNAKAGSRKKETNESTKWGKWWSKRQERVES